MIIGDNIKVDVWDMKRSLPEFVRLVRTATGPEQMLGHFMEAKRELRESEYRLFRKETADEYEVLIQCGGFIEGSPPNLITRLGDEQPQ